MVRAAVTRASPSSVRGPVLHPPCIRHRPFRMAGERHGVACRVRAPQRGAELGLPRGLPLRSGPVRGAVEAVWGNLGPYD
jgi:hypothetical protein